MTSKYDWNRIEKDYTHSITLQNSQKHHPTFKKLSEIYNLPLSTIKNHAARNHWTEKRKEAKNELTMAVFDDKMSHDIVSKCDRNGQLREERLDCLCDDLLDLIEVKIHTYKAEPGYIKESQLKSWLILLRVLRG